MVLVWQNYTSDLGRVYPMYALSVSRVNDVATTIDPLLLLPTPIIFEFVDLGSSCSVGGLTPRTLSLFTSDGANFRLTYPQPFDEVLANHLTTNIDVVAWEFIGERIRYGRLRRILDFVRP